jgi:hypothetical protein
MVGLIGFACGCEAFQAFLRRFSGVSVAVLAVFGHLDKIGPKERVSATICAKNQALNENIDKVIRILRRNFQIDIFVLKSGFASEWLN